MKNKLATIIMGVLAVLTMGVAAAIVPQTEVDAKNCPAGSYRTGDDYGNPATCNMDESKIDKNGNGIWKTVNDVINVALGVLGIIAVIMIIYGGFKFTTSAGDASKVKSGKDTILYGIVGLIIALLAFAIVNFVIGAIVNGSSNNDSGSDSGAIPAENSRLV